MPDIAKLLWPETVAVIGASPNTQRLRGMIMEVLLDQPFAGEVYPVNASHDEILGRKSYPSIDAVPATVDLAVLAIPADAVVSELERCGAAGVKAAAIITSGFAEQADDAGRELQSRLQAIIKRYDMAVIGPNALGFANLAASLCPTFSPALRKPELPLLPSWHKDGGRVAVIAQSGALGYSFYDRGRLRELPFRYIVTTGNEAGLHAFDLVEYMLDEGDTDVFLLFLEDIRDPTVFRRAAEKALQAGKPIIVAKIGQSEAARLSAASHTGALAGSHRINQAVFDAYGIITANDQDEMIDLASAFLTNRHRLPAGRNVGISSGTGGGGGWLSDACVANGLDVPELDPATRETIDAVLPVYGSSRNPVDGTAQAIREVGYARLLEMVGKSERVDALAMVTTARAGETYLQEKDDFFRVGQTSDKPIVVWTYTWPRQETVALFAEAGYPLMTNLRNAARAISLMADYRNKRETFIRPLDVAAAPAKGDPVAMTEFAAKQRLAAHGIGAGNGVLAVTRDEAVAASRAIDGPVVLKIQSRDILHKTDAGGVALNLTTPEAVGEAFERISTAATRTNPAAAIDGVLVEPMAPPGREMIVGITRDAVFGPMLLVGLGGIYAEVMDDVALAPLTDSRAAAKDQIARLKTASVLEGVRGEAPGDIDALADLMVALSKFVASDGAGVEEIDLNPVLVHERGKGVSVVDALITQRQ